MTRDDWHFPRRKFARLVFGLLAHSPLPAVTLFGRRRIGKTQFLTHDLAPWAARRGHAVVYASFWRTSQAPMAALLYALDQAVRHGPALQRLRAGLAALAPRFKISPPGGGEVEIDLARLPRPEASDHVRLVNDYCARLANERRPAVFLFDEVQELAHGAAAGVVMSALRTALDAHHGGLAAVFTGSSEGGLRAIFSARDAPFYRFATDVSLPVLGADFVSHQLAVFHRTAARTLAKADAVAAFTALHCEPMAFQHWLMTVLLDRSVTPAAAVARVRADLASRLGLARLWSSFSALERAMARAAAAHDVAGERDRGDPQVRRATTAQRRAAAARLVRLGAATQGADGLAITDPVFANWILEQPET